MNKDEYARLIGTIDCVRDDVSAIKVDVAEVRGDVKTLAIQHKTHTDLDERRFDELSWKLDKHDAEETGKFKAIEMRQHDWRKSIIIALIAAGLGALGKWLVG
jgi:hypothetical protein